MSTVLDPVHTEKPKIDDGTGNSFMAEVRVLNDDTFPMDLVVLAFCQVLPGYTPEKAVQVMLTIHNEGVGTVWQGPREVCELYAEQLNGHGLDAKVV